MKVLYRIEGYRQLTDTWEPEDVSADRLQAINIAKQRPVVDKVRIVDFEPRAAYTKNGNLVVLDEQGRVVFDAKGNKGPLYGGSRKDTEALQRRLAVLGFLKPIDVDGIYGPKTDAALKAAGEAPTVIDEAAGDPADPIDTAIANFHRKQQRG